MPFESVIVERDCPAVLIPEGVSITLNAGTEVYVTQALGGSVTLNVNGSLARVAGQDLDALGMEPVALPAHDAVAPADGKVDEELLWNQLRTCYDPEIPVNIVELGLIYACDIEPLAEGGNRVSIRMTLTAPGCGMGPFLVEDVRQKALEVPGVTACDVDLVFDPPWNQSMMSDVARLETGLMY
ncbi:MAG: putative Fe-S cluster assembly protein SufT [Gammaproteobacteria bacterium]|nr:putative Fe-S cluster assembly protein SufT [Gammaproteobacteria bacterium]